MRKSTQMPRVAVVPPLRARKPNNGPLYFRPPDVEASLVELYPLERLVVAERSRIIKPTDPDFVRSECILHFVRQRRSTRWQDAFGLLFMSLRQRILSGTRVPLSRLRGDMEEEKIAYEQDVSDFVLDQFLDMLKKDTKGYETGLDHFEIRFNQALKLDRIDAVRKVQRRPKLRSFDECGVDAVHPESEAQFVAVFQNRIPNGEEITYRNEIVAAIDQLCDDEREVIRLVVMEYSNVEIAKLLKCTEKTVYNRKKRAMAKLEVFRNEVSNE